MKLLRTVLAAVVFFPTAAFAQITVSAPNGQVNVKAADDFATTAFQDPWDMSQRTDLGWFLFGTDAPQPQFTGVTFANGEFSGTTTGNDPTLFLLESGFPAVPVGKFGTVSPIDASAYKLLAIRMSRSTNSLVNAQLFWWRGTMFDNTLSSGVFATTGGYRTYLVDLSTLSRVDGNATGFNWGGSVGALRFDPTTVAGETVKIDWARLVTINQTLCRTINWSNAANVDIYLDNDNDAANGNLGPVALGAASTSGAANSASAGCPTTGTGYKLNVGALQPGDYYVAVAPQGGAPTNYSTGFYRVNDIPTFTFTSPSDEGSDDEFAGSVLGDAWDMNVVSDVDTFYNVSTPTVTPMDLERPDGTPMPSTRVLLAVSGNSNDPIMALLDPGKRGRTRVIDADKYRLLTVEFGVANRARDILNGSIARVVWHQKGLPPGADSVSDDIVFNSHASANVLNKFTMDMKTVPVEQGTGAGGTNWTNGAGGGIDGFRFDPHEYSTQTSFFVRRVKLADFERAKASYTIRWTSSEPGATVDLYYSTTAGSSCSSGIFIASVSASAGQYVWNTSALASNPATTAYVCAVSNDGTNTNQTFAKWPVLLDSTYTPKPRMVLNRTTLNYGTTAGGAIKTSPQTVRVNFTGQGGPACWTVANPRPDIMTVTPASRTGNGSFTVTLNNVPFGGAFFNDTYLTVNECTPNTIMNPGVQVHVVWRNWAGSSPPTGTVDAPLLDGTMVSGSIAVMGWAVDDVQVAAVRIYRDAVAGETPGRRFIGDATFVEDARPDVEGANPDAPFHYRLGWGYLLLTNFLPNGGDGNFTLRAYATDAEGRETLLGSKSIVGVNSTTTRPFGAIDTPAQGEIITTTGPYNNFGWVLARGIVHADPPNGGSVSVVIDGAVVGAPAGWSARGDLTALFPKALYDGVDRAVGLYTFTPSLLTTGVHTIAWVVFANNGLGDGIGSRYFTVANGSGLVLDGSPLASRVAFAPQPLDPGMDLGRRAADVGAIDASTAVVVEPPPAGRARPRPVAADATGLRTIYGRELERVAVRAASASGRRDAYLVANGALAPLPVGASFDASTGTLYWLPGPGFTGAYDFAIVSAGGSRVPLRIVLRPGAPVRRETHRLVHGLFAEAAPVILGLD